MTRQQLWLVYFLTVFMLLYGFNFINYGLLQRDYSTAVETSFYDITGLIYIVATLLAVRLIMQQFYPRKQYLWMSLSLSLLIPGFVFFRYLLEEIIAPILIGQSNYVDTITFGYYFGDNFSYALYYIIIGGLLYLLDHSIINSKKVKLLETQHREAELNYLQTQFNPHFLFNSLNNIYALVTEKSDKAGEAVLLLSDMTRYLIYEKTTLCFVKEELMQTENYINLQKLRFNYELPVKIQLEGEYESKLMPPFTLVTFVENAFKHGDFKDEHFPLSIHVVAKSDELKITVKNKIGQFNKDATNGVGLENIRKRLALIFPNKHLLICSNENNNFTVQLTIYN